MRILVVTNHSYMLYRFRKRLIFELMKENEVILAMPFVGHEDDFKNAGIRCIETSIDRRGTDPFKELELFRLYKKLVSELEPDAVVTYSIKPNIYLGLICKHKKIPYYTNVQGLGTAFEKPLLRNIVSVLYRLALKKAEKVFFENGENEELFVSKSIVSKTQTKLLNGAGVDTDEYGYSEPNNDGVCSFLFIGRIMREKGVEEFFSAAKRLKSEFSQKVEFDVVGFYEDEYKSVTEELISSGIIRFHGFQEDVYPYYKSCDCVVLPSYHEGMSNVLLEGAAVGRALITSDIPGCREAVEDGVSGFLCGVGDARFLYEKMRRFVLMTFGEQKEMGIRGRELVIKKFDKTDVVRATVEAMELDKIKCIR